MKKAGSLKTRCGAIAAACALALVALPLAACSGQPAADEGAEGEAAPEAAPEEAPDAAEPAEAVVVTPEDIAGWTTLGDALAVATEDPSFSYNDDYFTCAFNAGSTIIYATAKSRADLGSELYELDFSDPQYLEKLIGVIGDLELISAEDVTADLLDQEALDALAGKTGQELLDEGWVFQNYNFYGGEQTGAEMANGYFLYDITFDVSTPEENTEDGGASILNAPVVEAYHVGFSNAALDPEAVAAE